MNTNQLQKPPSSRSAQKLAARVAVLLSREDAGLYRTGKEIAADAARLSELAVIIEQRSKAGVSAASALAKAERIARPYGAWKTETGGPLWRGTPDLAFPSGRALSDAL